MQIILASAKIMNDRLKSMPDISLSTPRFQNEAETFARDMAQYSTETIAEMLGCSQQIAAQNKLRFMQFCVGVPDYKRMVRNPGLERTKPRVRTNQTQSQ